MPTPEPSETVSLSSPLSFLADLLGIFGFFMALWSAKKVRTINARFALKTLAPNLKKRLGAAQKNLQTGLNENLPDLVGEALNSAKACLDALVDLAEDPFLQNVYWVRGKVNELVDVKALNRDPAACRDVQEKLTLILEGMEHAVRDLVRKGTQ
jgi:hypothetical protein